MKFSIIVPVYNVENYLEQCLQSIVNQTYRDFDVLLIDDGSTDSSGRICDEYARKFTFVKTYHKENGGLSSARNYGIEKSGGEFIVLVDSDDFVSTYLLQILAHEIDKTSLNMFVIKDCVNFWDGEDDTVKLLNNDKDYCEELVDSKEALVETLYYKFAMGAPFKVCHRSLYDNVKFPEGWLYEDAATVYKLFFETSNVCVISGDLYAYRKRKDSIIRSEFNKDKMISIDVTRQIVNDITESEPNNKKLLAAAYDRAFGMNYSLFLQIPPKETDYRNLAWNELKKYRYKVMFDNSGNTRRKDKLAAIVTFMGKRIAYFIGRKYGQKGNMQ